MTSLHYGFSFMFPHRSHSSSFITWLVRTWKLGVHSIFFVICPHALPVALLHVWIVPVSGGLRQQSLLKETSIYLPAVNQDYQTKGKLCLSGWGGCWSLWGVYFVFVFVFFLGGGSSAVSGNQEFAPIFTHQAWLYCPVPAAQPRILGHSV